MAKKDIEQLSRRIEFLEMQIKELKTVDPGVVNEKLKSLEDAIYTTKEILNMKDVCQYLDISKSLLYKLTCSGEIPHFKDLPLPLGPRQKKLELSVILFLPSLPLMSMATGTPCRSV